MNPLTNYAEVFNKNDSKLFAELFADDCIFYDTAPTCAGMDPMFVRGKEGVDMKPLLDGMFPNRHEELHEQFLRPYLQFLLKALL